MLFVASADDEIVGVDVDGRAFLGNYYDRFFVAWLGFGSRGSLQPLKRE